MLFGVNIAAHHLLKCLDYSVDDIPRFRDAYLKDGHIVIYTRTGGGNREFYENETCCRENFPEHFGVGNDPKGPWNDDLRKHTCFVRDEDSDFDRTYALFYFIFPQGYRHDLESIEKGQLSSEPSEKWKKLFDILDNS